MVQRPTFFSLDACPRGQVTESEAMLSLKATSGPKYRGASSRYSALAARSEVPSPSPPIFFSIDACALGSSPHCAEVYCSLSHAFNFENVCCLAKEMTSQQYKMRAKFITAVCVHHCSFLSVELQFA